MAKITFTCKGEGMSKVMIPTDNVAFFFNTLCTMCCDEHIIFPPISAPSHLFLKSVGQETLIKVILHHHSLLRQIAVVNFYREEYQSFMEEVTKIAHFMIEAFGCGQIYTKEYGQSAMSLTQKPFYMDENSREVWLRLFAKTLREMAFPQTMLAEFWNWIELFSLRMLNTSALSTLPKRFYFESMKGEFESATLRKR